MQQQEAEKQPEPRSGQETEDGKKEEEEEQQQAQANENKKRNRDKEKERVGSLGWLTESAVMPKKQKPIAGVGVSSLVQLKAQLYQSQQQRHSHNDDDEDAHFHRAAAAARSIPKHKINPFSAHNSGVHHRDQRDKLELKAVNDGSASYAALEKKAELYSKLVRGEVDDEEENEKYCVDFFMKGALQNEPETSGTGIVEMVNGSKVETLSSSDQDATRAGIGWTGFTGVGSQHKKFIREVNDETIKAREKASILKQQRQLQAEKHREKLRQAFLRKQIEKLKAQQSNEECQSLSSVDTLDQLDKK